MTERGTTARSARGAAAPFDATPFDDGAAAGSGGASMPAAWRISRSRARVSGSGSASSVSSVSSEPSRAAVRASTVATPSRRLSCSARRASLRSSAWMRARSWRTSSATAWKVLRVVGPTRPRCTAASTSRTALVSTGTTPCSFFGRPWRGCRFASVRDRRRSDVATHLPFDVGIRHEADGGPWPDVVPAGGAGAA
jgi:hypothetical protein